jgi:hypothetical protein
VTLTVGTACRRQVAAHVREDDMSGRVALLAVEWAGWVRYKWADGEVSAQVAISPFPCYFLFSFFVPFQIQFPLPI